MHIHIEARNRWTFTLTTSNHHTGEETVRPGAQPFVCLDSKSGTTDNPTIKVPRRSLGAYDTDPIEENYSEPRRAKKTARRGSFRKRIGQFFVHFHRMHPVVDVCPHYDVGDPLPPYEHFNCPELPADQSTGCSAIQELPDTHHMIPELIGQAEAELEGYENHRYGLHVLPMDAMQGQVLSEGFVAWTKSIYSGNEYEISCGSVPVPTPASPSRLGALEHLCCLPDMTSGENSHDSSPISPFTPRTEPGSGIQLQPGSESLNGIVSPQEFSPHNVGSYTMNRQAYRVTQDYDSIQALSSPAIEHSMGASASSTPTTDRDPYNTSQFLTVPSTPSSSFHDVTLHQQLRQEPLSSQPIVRDLVTHQLNYDDYRLGVWERDDNMEWTSPSNQEPVSRINPNMYRQVEGITNRRQSWTSFQIEELDHNTASNAGGNSHLTRSNAVTYPPEICYHCGTPFHGKYRKGNLKRHIRETHDDSKSTVGRTCRKCGLEFHRADAKRKHEWKKHRIPDAKPTKRRS